MTRTPEAADYETHSGVKPLQAKSFKAFFIKNQQVRELSRALLLPSFSPACVAVWVEKKADGSSGADIPRRRIRAKEGSVAATAV